MKMPTFWGGTHPPESKSYTYNEKTEVFLPQSELVFPMSQHIGAPNTPAVKKGDRVLVGSVLGTSDAVVSAPVLSSVSGTVKDVAPRMTSSGWPELCAVVENDGRYETDASWKPLDNFETTDPQKYIARVREAGIVGFGGAAFPTAVKLSPPHDSQIRFVIANGLECEPYLNCDNRLMLEEPEKIIGGLRLVLRLFPEARGVVAIENNKPDAIKIMTAAAPANVSVQPCAVKYPQGAEKMLIEAVTRQEYPLSKLPADVGCIVLNVRTLHQIWEAIAEGRPSVTRVVTVSGDAVAHPKNLRVPLGTNVRELTDRCGGFSEEPAIVLSGGPMMGVTLRTLDVPVVKGTSGILALTEQASGLYKTTSCIRCGRCVEACPMGLMPYLLDALVSRRKYKEFENKGGMNCIECGSCTYVCPARRHLTQACRDGKASVNAERRKAAAK